MTRIPILGYHHISAPPVESKVRNLHVTPTQFERQMWLLKKLGLTGMSMSAGFEHIRRGTSVRGVILTFDDGYLDNITDAMPILKHFGFSATCYLVSGLIGKHNAWDADRAGSTKPLMATAHIEQWLDAGMEIGSHTHTHPNLIELSDDDAIEELAHSRTTLSAAFGRVTRHFCYPYGRCNERLLRLVKKVGYVSAVSQRRGIANAKSNPFCLPRVSVLGDQGMFLFALKLLTGYENFRGRRDILDFPPTIIDSRARESDSKLYEDAQRVRKALAQKNRH
jgi:peptidoglycan/xylan/chitin deacetylase (PgdA/CDA1 family)